MFGEIFAFVRDTIQFIWPFRIVHQWERGGYYVCGKWWRDVGPGLKVVVPWFCDVKEITLAPHPVSCSRGDITLSDNSILSFDATATMRVRDPYKALNEIEDFSHSTMMLLGAVLAEKLAEVDAVRLAPEKRKRLFSDLSRWVNDETMKFGVEVSDVRFTSFVLNLRTYRLLTDGPGLLA